MLKTNALDLRQNLGKLLSRLKKTGEPILVERNRQPAAVLIPLEEYQRRFVDKEVDEKRRALVEEIKKAKIKLPKGKKSIDYIRELRS